MHFTDYLKSMSMAYYLRPVTAVWRAYEAAYFDLVTLKQNSSNWVELGVGDGLQAAIASGVKINPDFNAYTFMSSSWGNAKQDLNDRVDVFDEFPNKELTLPTSNAINLASPWSLGIDHKESLLQKAQLLRVFRSLRKADMNQPQNLFNKGENFELTFSNSLYWSRNPHEVLLSVREHTTKLYLSLKLTSYRNHLIGAMSSLGSLAIYLDKDRSKHDGISLSAEEWFQMLDSTGFLVDDFIYHAPARLVQAIEWVDQREWAPMIGNLANMAEVSAFKKFQSDTAEHIQNLGLLAFQSDLLHATESDANYILVKASVKS